MELKFCLFVIVTAGLVFAACSTSAISSNSTLPEYFEDDFDDEIETDQYYESFCKNDQDQTRTLSFNPNDVKFYHYDDPSNVNARKEIVFGNTLTLKSLTPYKEVKIIVHGFNDNSTKFCNSKPKQSINIVAAYLKKQIPNVICVDWGKLAVGNPKIIPPETSLALPFYIPVLGNIGKVGKRIAQFVQFLVANKIVESPDLVHLLGHSLGAHVVGAAGDRTKKATKIPIGRISGLDPAGPFTIFLQQKDKLDKNDAKFIDITHTNTDFFGTFESLGTVDFYSFGGRGIDQPDCKNQTILGVTAFNCGHEDAPKYFALSITGKDFQGCRCMKTNFEFFQNPQCLIPKGKKCTKPVKYGEHVPKTAKGNYYFRTNDEKKTG